MVMCFHSACLALMIFRASLFSEALRSLWDVGFNSTGMEECTLK